MVSASTVRHVTRHRIGCRFRLVFMMLAAIGMTTVDAAAQRAPEPLARRDHLRVTLSHGAPALGYFSGWAGDSLALAPDHGSSLRIARADILKIERPSKISPARLRRAAIWVGAPMGLLTGLGCMFTAGKVPLCAGAAVLQGAVFGGLGAGLVYALGTGPWSEVPPALWGAEGR